MQRCAHGSAPVGALPWAQHALCASDWLNFMLICNISDGLLDYAKVIAYLATHSQTNTYQSPQNRWHSSSHPQPAQTSYRLPCWIVALRHYVTWLSPRVRGFFVIQEYLERSRGRRRCIKECATAVAQVTGALLNATRLWTSCHYSNAHVYITGSALALHCCRAHAINMKIENSTPYTIVTHE